MAEKERCRVCGHAINPDGSCDSCAFDRWAEEREAEREADDDNDD